MDPLQRRSDDFLPIKIILKMNIRSTKYAVIAVITFIILFLFNYIGNPLPDKLERALMTAVAGVVGLTIGMWFVYRNSKDDTHHDFD